MDDPVPTSVVFATLGRIESKLDRLISEPESPTITTDEAMKLTGCKSRTAFYRLAKEWNVQAVTRNKFRRNDLLSAMGRIVIARQRQHRLDAEAELKAEARRILSRSNPHDD